MTTPARYLVVAWIVATAGCADRANRELMAQLEPEDGACSLALTWEYGLGDGCVDTVEYEVRDAFDDVHSGSMEGTETNRVDSLVVAVGEAIITWEVTTLGGNRMQREEPFGCPDRYRVNRYVVVDCEQSGSSASSRSSGVHIRRS